MIVDILSQHYSSVCLLELSKGMRYYSLKGSSQKPPPSRNRAKAKVVMLAIRREGGYLELLVQNVRSNDHGKISLCHQVSRFLM